jgi:hypothetical protein
MRLAAGKWYIPRKIYVCHKRRSHSYMQISKYIIKDPNIMTGTSFETIEHVQTIYKNWHKKIANFELAIGTNHILRIINIILRSSWKIRSYKFYWDHTLLTNRIVHFNLPVITLVDKTRSGIRWQSNSINSKPRCHNCRRIRQISGTGVWNQATVTTEQDYCNSIGLVCYVDHPQHF